MTKRANCDDDNLLATTVFPLVEHILGGQEKQQGQDGGGDDIINNYEVLFLELQQKAGNENGNSAMPRLTELRRAIQHWRQLAEQHETFFFAFTILQHPVSFHVEQLNRQWHLNATRIINHQAPLCSSLPSNQDQKWCQHQPLEQQAQENEASVNTTNQEEELLRTIHANDQCSRLLSRSSHYDSSSSSHNHNDSSTNSTSSFVLTHGDCQMAYNFMLANLDWIGTTTMETTLQTTSTSTTMTTTTALLLEHLLHVPFSLSRNAGGKRQQQQQPSLLAVPNLHASTIQAIQSMSALDLELYQRASQDYVLPPELQLVHSGNSGGDHGVNLLDDMESANDDDYDDDEEYDDDTKDHEKDYHGLFRSDSKDNNMDMDLTRQQQH
jgi:hypothetical protein